MIKRGRLYIGRLHTGRLYIGHFTISSTQVSKYINQRMNTNFKKSVFHDLYKLYRF